MRNGTRTKSTNTTRSSRCYRFKAPVSSGAWVRIPPLPKTFYLTLRQNLISNSLNIVSELQRAPNVISRYRLAKRKKERNNRQNGTEFEVFLLMFFLQIIHSIGFDSTKEEQTGKLAKEQSALDS